MSVDWSYFDRFDRAMDMYLPSRGEGDTLATQIVTAVSKLVYKWYNDGDVFDNTGSLQGWCNDLSSYANWLRKNTSAFNILDAIHSCETHSDYEDLLRDLADYLLDDEFLDEQNKYPKQGSIYECKGPYKFEEYNDEEEDDE